MQDGRLVAGHRAPTFAQLAHELGVSRTVVVEAYGNLVADGYLDARQGSGTRVRRPVAVTTPERAQSPRPVARAARHVRRTAGSRIPACFPRREWLRHYRAALDELPDRALDLPRPPVRSTCAPRCRAISAACAGW